MIASMIGHKEKAKFIVFRASQDIPVFFARAGAVIPMDAINLHCG